jgi:hypothetical protein
VGGGGISKVGDEQFVSAKKIVEWNDKNDDQ